MSRTTANPAREQTTTGPTLKSAKLQCDRSMLLCLVKGFAWHFSGLISGVLKDGEQRVCWVADKTGKVHSGEGKLL